MDQSFGITLRSALALLIPAAMDPLLFGLGLWRGIHASANPVRSGFEKLTEVPLVFSGSLLGTLVDSLVGGPRRGQ